MKILKMMVTAVVAMLSLVLVGCGSMPLAEQIETGATVFAHAQKMACPAVGLAVGQAQDQAGLAATECKAPLLATALSLPSGMFLPKSEVDAINGYLSCLEARAASGRGSAQGID